MLLQKVNNFYFREIIFSQLCYKSVSSTSKSLTSRHAVLALARNFAMRGNHLGMNGEFDEAVEQSSRRRPRRDPSREPGRNPAAHRATVRSERTKRRRKVKQRNKDIGKRD